MIPESLIQQAQEVVRRGDEALAYARQAQRESVRAMEESLNYLYPRTGYTSLVGRIERHLEKVREHLGDDA